MTIKIIDLFAGPGGLGEGFAAYRINKTDKPFKISLSIEKDESAHKTLLLRAFYRQFPAGKVPDVYYEYLAGYLRRYPEDMLFKEKGYKTHAANALNEARLLTLGQDNSTINKAIENALGKRPGKWILIGGPPCQAYSLAGRSRNKGIKGYKLENDMRSYLYREYLKVLSRFRPAIFVMENVKGMISAKTDGTYIFPKIIDDLRCPKRALKNKDKLTEYEIFSFIKKPTSDIFGESSLKSNEYIICAENHGIPQTRHRVILLGVRKDLLSTCKIGTLKESQAPKLKSVISDLPKLRSRLSRQYDDLDNWINAIRSEIPELLVDIRNHKMPEVAKCISNTAGKIENVSMGYGSSWELKKRKKLSTKLPPTLKSWYEDPSGWTGVCNHETRMHIASDLHRYLFCACYAQLSKGEFAKTRHFPKSLYADHASWKSGDFADRFRVQVANKEATTITSHISKDGHYYIHYDPIQCRSLTVREAARIQTFPDNYFFVGYRTQQYVQVGNAVPPYLANQIADIIYKISNNM